MPRDTAETIARRQDVHMIHGVKAVPDYENWIGKLTGDFYGNSGIYFEDEVKYLSILKELNDNNYFPYTEDLLKPKYLLFNKVNGIKYYYANLKPGIQNIRDSENNGFQTLGFNHMYKYGGIAIGAIIEERNSNETITFTTDTLIANIAEPTKLFMFAPFYINIDKNSNYEININALYEHSKYIRTITNELIELDQRAGIYNDHNNIEEVSNILNWKIFNGNEILFVEDEDFNKILYYEDWDMFGILADDITKAEKIMDKYPEMFKKYNYPRNFMRYWEDSRQTGGKTRKTRKSAKKSKKSKKKI